MELGKDLIVKAKIIVPENVSTVESSKSTHAFQFLDISLNSSNLCISFSATSI